MSLGGLRHIKGCCIKWKDTIPLVKLMSGYGPQFNGQVEKVSQEISRNVRLYCSWQQPRWSEFLSWAEYAKNSLWHSSTGPMFLWSGKSSSVPAVDNWICHSKKVWNSVHVPQHSQGPSGNRNTGQQTTPSTHLYQPGQKGLVLHTGPQVAVTCMLAHSKVIKQIDGGTYKL